MEALNRITAVSLTTFRETIRNKVLLHLFGFAAAMMAIGWVVSNWSLGEPGKIMSDIGLTVTTLSGVAIALFSGIVLVWGEVDQKTILPILAKPLPRREYVIGKYLGFAGAVSLVYAGMNFLLILLLTVVGEGVTSGIFAAIYLSWWEVLIVTALALLFSSFSSPTMSALFTIMLFIAGRFSNDIRIYVADNPLSYSKPVLESVYAILPHFGAFNIRLEAVHNLQISFERLLYPSIYGVLYCFTTLTLAILVFRKRDLA
jgi:ABC-type transport system involved in multi-copper enzyme maturation permease subunit